MAHFAINLHHAAAREPSAPAAPLGEASAFGLMTLCWLLSSGSWIAAKWVTDDFPPWGLTFFRVFLACLFLSFFVVPHLREMAKIARERFVVVLVVGALGLCLAQGFIFTGLAYTTAINAGLIFAISPIITLVLAGIVLGERLGSWQVVGAACAVGGMVVIISQGNPELLRTLDLNAGDLWILLGALCFSLYTVFLKKVKFALSVLPLLVLFLSAATIVAAPLFAWELLHDERATFNWNAVAGILYVAIPGGGIMYLLYNIGVKALGAGKAGVTFYLQMVFIAVLAYLLLGERLYAYHFVGIGLIAAGVLLVTLLKAKGKPRIAAAK